MTVNQDSRREIVWDMQRIIFDDVVYIIPFYTNAVQAYRTDTFTGWPVNAEKIALEDIHSILLLEPIR